MKPPFEYRMVIIIIMGGCVPVLITQTLHHYFNYSIKSSMELTLILCIPLAIWLASKINDRWHDDRED